MYSVILEIHVKQKCCDETINEGLLQLYRTSADELELHQISDSFTGFVDIIINIT